MENGEEQAYYQAMGDAAEAEAQAAMNAEDESKSQDEVKDDPVASYRAELKKKIEEMIVWHDDAVLVSKQLLFDLIDQTEKP